MIDRYGIHLGTLYIHFYALLILIGAGLAAELTAHRAKLQGHNSDHIWNSLLWVLVPAVIGARLYHVLTPTPASGLTTQYYFTHPLEMLAIWNGGLGIYGGVIGGVFGAWYYTHRHSLRLLTWLDLAAPGVLLAQALGRWGNFINQELYGAPTTLPWAIQISLDKRLPGFERFSTFHPLFLYESLWNLFSMSILLWLDHRFQNQVKDGDLVLLYLILYPIGRFLLDFVRLDSNGSGAFTTAQLVSLITCLASSVMLLWQHRRQRTGQYHL